MRFDEEFYTIHEYEAVVVRRGEKLVADCPLGPLKIEILDVSVVVVPRNEPRFDEQILVYFRINDGMPQEMFGTEFYDALVDCSASPYKEGMGPETYEYYGIIEPEAKEKRDENAQANHV